MTSLLFKLAPIIVQVKNWMSQIFIFGHDVKSNYRRQTYLKIFNLNTVHTTNSLFITKLIFTSMITWEVKFPVSCTCKNNLRCNKLLLSPTIFSIVKF